MPNTTEATSPAAQTKSGDAQTTGPSNLQTSQAAVLLMAKAAETPKQPTRQAAEETVPADAPAANAEEVASNPTAEAPAASEAPAETETAEPEAPVAEEPAAEDEADAVHSQTISFTPEQQEIFNKRVGKEVAKTKALKAQMEEAKTKLAELEAKVKAAPAATEAPAAAAPIVVNPNIPLGDVADIETLGKRQQAAKEAIRYIEEVLDDTAQWQTVTDPANPDREIKVHKVGEQLLTESDLKRSMRQARVTLEDHIPARQQFLAARDRSVQQAVADFPFLKDKQSPEYQLVEMAKRNPAMAPILSMPNADWLLAAMAMSVRTLQAKAADAEKAKAAPAAKPKLPAAKPPSDQTATSASGAATRAPIGHAERQRVSQESAKLSAKGGITSDDAVRLLAQSSRIKTTR